VIFMDGTNQGPDDDAPIFSEELAEEMRNAGSGKSVMDNLDWLPLARLASAIRRRLADAAPQPTAPPPVVPTDLLEERVNRFARNQEIATAVAKLYDVQTLFFLQPNALYNYPPELYRLSLPQSFLEQRADAQKLYSLIAQKQMGRIDL